MLWCCAPYWALVPRLSFLRPPSCLIEGVLGGGRSLLPWQAGGGARRTIHKVETCMDSLIHTVRESAWEMYVKLKDFTKRTHRAMGLTVSHFWGRLVTRPNLSTWRTLCIAEWMINPLNNERLVFKECYLPNNDLQTCCLQTPHRSNTVEILTQS